MTTLRDDEIQTFATDGSKLEVEADGPLGQAVAGGEGVAPDDAGDAAVVVAEQVEVVLVVLDGGVGAAACLQVLAQQARGDLHHVRRLRQRPRGLRQRTCTR